MALQKVRLVCRDEGAARWILELAGGTRGFFIDRPYIDAALDGCVVILTFKDFRGQPDVDLLNALIGNEVTGVELLHEVPAAV